MPYVSSESSLDRKGKEKVVEGALLTSTTQCTAITTSSSTTALPSTQHHKRNDNLVDPTSPFDAVGNVDYNDPINLELYGQLFIFRSKTDQPSIHFHPPLSYMEDRREIARKLGLVVGKVGVERLREYQSISRMPAADESEENAKEKVPVAALIHNRKNSKPSHPSTSFNKIASEGVAEYSKHAEPALVLNKIMIDRDAIHKLKKQRGQGSRSGKSRTRSMAEAMEDLVFIGDDPAADYSDLVISGASELAWTVQHAKELHMCLIIEMMNGRLVTTL